MIMIVIERIESEYGDIRILETLRNRSFVYEQGGCCQSEADADGVSLASYVHGMFGLLAQAPLDNVLMIGCGGGCLGTMLSRYGIKVDIVDINAQAFDIARQYFHLPDDVRCHAVDGREFLLSDPTRYGAIIMDAYVGSLVPPHLRSESFFRLARNRLHVGSGRLIANVFVEHDFDAAPDRAATSMGETWNNVRVLDIRGRHHRNALVMAGDVSGLRPPGLLMRPIAGVEEILHDLERWRFRPWKSIWD